MKSIFLFSSFLFSASLMACSCIATYQPLAEMICNAKEYDGVVFEMRLNRRTSEGAFFTVETVLTGEITRSEVFLYAGNGADCGLPVDQYPVNFRYLYFSSPNIDSTGVGRTFECGPARNLYQLNAFATQIRYMTPGDQSNSWPGPLEWQNYQLLLSQVNCELESPPALPRENPLKAVGLTANPGGGMIQLYTPFDTFPEIDKIQVFDISGRQVFSSPVATLSPNQPYDLSSLPIGVYAVVISNQTWRRGMKYVKAR